MKPPWAVRPSPAISLPLGADCNSNVAFVRSSFALTLPEALCTTTDLARQWLARLLLAYNNGWTSQARQALSGVEPSEAGVWLGNGFNPAAGGKAHIPTQT
jgi:hypothetical protein